MEVRENKIYNYIIDGNLKIENIVEDYSNYIYSIVRKYRSNLSNEDIEEIRLDVFFIVWKNKEKLDVNKNLSSYIAGITRNLIKQKWKYINYDENLDDYEEKIISAFNVENTFLKREKNIFILETLKKMKEEDRNIFIQYYFENKTIKDISNQNNISESKVGTKLHRIRKKIKKFLKEGGY